MRFHQVSFWGLVALLLCSTAVGSAQILAIQVVSGNGQLVQQGFQAAEPLTVKVTDASTGAPVANVIVTWSIPLGQGAVQDSQTITDATGLTSTRFSAQGVFGNVFTAYLQGTVTASTATGAAVNFTETTALTDLNTGAIQVTARLISGDSGLTGGVGTQSQTPIQIFVGSIQTQLGIPNVSLHLTGTDPATGPAITCAGGTPPGTVYTDASGIANCYPVFLGRIGSSTANIVVGGGFASFERSFTVTVGPPGMIRIIQGDNQSGNTGQVLPTPLLAVVADAAGNPLGGIPVTFEPVVPGAASISNLRSPSGGDGRVSATVTLGNTPGPVQIRVRTTDGSNVSAIFNETALLAITALQKLSGEPQDAIINTMFAQPLVVQVNNQGVPQPNVPVQFRVTSGTGLVGNPPAATTATANTDSSGQARMSVQAGGTVGTLVITASAGTFSQTFTLNVRPLGPALTTSSFFNAAGGQQLNAVAPCGLVQIIANGVAIGIQGAVVAPGALYFGPLPIVLAGVTVQFGTNNYAPLFAVANQNNVQSVTLQVPCNLTSGVTPVTVTASGATGTVNMQVVSATPGIFETQMSDSVNRAVVQRPDGSTVSLQNPARPGETMRVYVTGLGNPGILGTNQFGDDSPLNIPVVVGVNNSGVQVTAVRAAQNLIGVYEVTFVLPLEVGTGDNIPFALAVESNNTLVFGNPSRIVIR